MNPAALISKQKNARNILNYIIKYGEVSRPALAAAFDLSTATVTNIITELMSQNLVYEGRSENTGLGRKAKLIRFNSKLHYVVAINIADASTLKLWVCDLLGEVKECETRHIELELSAHNPEEKIVTGIVSVVTDFLKKISPDVAEKLTAVAISIPGMVGYNESIYAPFFNWNNLPLSKPLQAAIHLPVFFENVTRVKATYEMRYVDEKEKNIVFLTTTPGVGMVNYFDGKMIMGKTGISGEIGHMSINFNGPACYCGNRGCFEHYCGELSLLRHGKSMLAEDDILRELMKKSNMPVSIETMIEAWEKGSIKMHQFFSEISRYLASGLVTIINCFDPDRIVLSGTLVEQSDFVFNSAVQEAKSHIINKFTRDVCITRPKLGENQIEKAICAYLLTLLFDRMFKSL